MNQMLSGVVSPPSQPKTIEKIDEKNENERRRQAFIKQLSLTKKPLLNQQKSNPTPLDMTNEEAISKYIVSEGLIDWIKDNIYKQLQPTESINTSQS